MKESRYTEEQVAFALKQAETDTQVAEVCGGRIILDAGRLITSLRAVLELLSV